MHYKSFFTLLFTCILISYTFSQNASLSGKITDSKTNEALFGAKVILQGLGKGAVTDGDGNYSLKGLSAGTYILEARNETYNNLILTEIKLKENENLVLNIPLDKVVLELGPVTVKAKVSRESTTEILRLQRNSATVVDGISSETFKKTPDSKASDVLKRISGASVQDNKFVVVRGLSDRYNFALINGAPLPSSESDRKAFSFDVFPSNMLDNLVIIKTATPDLPGEFAGGVIDINTTEPKENDFQSIQIGSSYNLITTFKDFKTYDGSKTDFLGFSSSSRALPSGLPSTEEFNNLSALQKAEYAQLIPSSWGTYSRVALPNLNLQYSIGKTIKLTEERNFGYVFAYNYQSNMSFNKVTRREFEESTAGVITKNELKDSAFTQSVLNSAMFNMKFKLNKNNSLQLKTLYSLSSDDKVNIRNGKRDMDVESVFSEKSTNIWYTQNKLLSSQLLGNHEFKNKMKFKWIAGISDVKREIPFLRRTVYQQSDTALPFAAVIQNNDISTLGAGNMFWSLLNEKIVSAKYDLSIPLEFLNTKTELKIGGMHQYRTRSFESRNLGFSKYDPAGNSSFNSQLLLLPEDQIFSNSNLGLMTDGQGGFKLEEGTNVDDSYQAFSLLNAAYAMFDTKITEKFRIVGGARLESYHQNFKYIEFGSNLQQNIDTTVVDILPSVNLIYSLTNKVNFRLSASKTVSRPEFRELAPFSFYNFLNDNLTSGDPTLKRASINNYDARFEFFPGAGQIFSVSAFYKQFTNPIEMILRTGTSGTPELYYDNVGNTKNYGAEFEYRMNLGFLNSKDSISFLKDITLYANASIIRSSVDLSMYAGQAEYTNSARPLQGQSPYIINAGIYYSAPKDVNFSLSYNLVGQRIAIAGSIQEPSVWENGRNVIDFQISKMFKKKLELKLNVKDLLAQDLIYFQDINKNKKYDKGTDNAWQEITFGQTVSMSLKYNF
jgi:outer membrane receptor protein involved in Fe transport